MTPRQRVETALRFGPVDRIPFTIYATKVRACAAERSMRRRGMCLVHRSPDVFRTHTPNVRTHQERVVVDGRAMVRTVHETPVGTLGSLVEPAGYTSWHHEKLFKGPNDYKPIAFMLADQQIQADYGPFARAQEQAPPDAIYRAGFGLEPMQTLMSGGIMDMADFCVEWMERRDEVLRLYQILVEKRRQTYDVVAESPALFANYGGNVTVSVIGPAVFSEYYVPHYNEAAEAMHRRGKLIGCHFDADCRLIADDIAGTALDYIEAFSPMPDTDMTLAEARRAWPDKVLWVNFPSSVHLHNDDRVRQTALDLVEQAGRAEGLIMAVTEDIPHDRWEDSCPAIMDGLDQHRAQRPGWYRG